MKRFLSIAVASAMVAAALTGCGGSGSSDSTAPAEGTENSTEDGGSASADGSGASADGAVFKIGGDRKSVV